MDDIEAVLSRHLARTAAPAGLRDRIKIAAANPRRGFSFRRAGPAWAAGVALLAAWYLRPSTLASSDPVQIRNWVHDRMAIDLPLRPDLPAAIHLTGARLRPRAVEISFQIGGRQGALRIPANASHRSYKVACATPEDERLACLLCHSDD